MELALNVTAKVMLTLHRGSIPLEAVVSHSPGTETPPPGPVPLSAPAFEMLLRSPAELPIKKKVQLWLVCLILSTQNTLGLDWDEIFPGNEAMLLELFVCFCFVLLYLCKCEKEKLLCACLARQCCILSGPRQRSSEPCRKIFLRVLAALCKCATSDSHSADIPQACPPAHARIISVHVRGSSSPGSSCFMGLCS